MKTAQSSTTLTAKVAALLAENAVSPQAGTMLCGLSGGADSVAMVLVLRELGYDVRALHCNFQLRGAESERDEAFVRQFCSRHSIPLLTTRFDTRSEAASRGESIEMAARRLRYAWFAQCAKELEKDNVEKPCAPPRICVAHHADDNVETMLLNLIRGAGLHGLTGMDVINDRGVVRPLLSVTREEITAYLSAHEEDYVVDSTNADTQYRRNRVRHELLPLLRTLNPSIDRTLTDTMSRLREAEAMLLADDVYARRARLQKYGFTMQQILQMEASRGGAFVTTTHCPSLEGEEVMLTRCGNELVVGRVPKVVAPTPLDEGLNNVEGGTSSLLESAVAIAVQREEFSAKLNLRDKCCAVIDAANVSGNLHVRSVSEGDRFRPFGMKGTKLVSDYLTDRKRSRLDKLAALVVCDDEGILWLVGETIDQRAAVTASTQNVVRVSVKYPKNFGDSLSPDSGFSSRL